MVDKTELILESMRNNPKGIKFSDLKKVCEYYFGKPRLTGGSHLIFKTPWLGDPRINIQNQRGMAKPYQVHQVIKAIDRLGKEND